MSIPTDLKYAKTHEWVRAEGDLATIGITYHAQQELGDVTFVELPEAGRVLDRGDIFGTVESVKAVSDLYSPVSGEVTEVNTATAQATETVNVDPYGQGWLVRIRMSTPDELDDLMGAAGYEQMVEESGH